MNKNDFYVVAPRNYPSLSLTASMLFHLFIKVSSIFLRDRTIQ